MKIKLSINKNIINKVDEPNSSGWQNVEMDVDELVHHIANGYAFSPGVLKPDASSKKPTKSDIDYAELLVLDIDNDIKMPDGTKRKKNHEEKYLEFDAFSDNDWSKKNLLLAYTTPSHKTDHHKFRLVFKLPERIYDPEVYTKYAKAFIAHSGADAACSNIDRLFFGNTKSQFIIHKGLLSQEAIDYELNRPKNDAEAKKIYKSTGANGSISPDMVAEMLSFIPRQLDYIEWLKIVSAVGNYFSPDIDTAVQLIDNWSPDTKRGTKWRLQHLQHSGNKATIATVIWCAKHNGFDVSSLYQNLSETSVDENGKIKKRKGRKDKAGVKDIQDYLSAKYDFRYNVIKSYVEYKLKFEDSYVQLVDRCENSLWCELELAGIEVPIGDLQKVLTSDFVPEYHPFIDYFDNLPEWDGHDHIEDFVNAIKVQDDQQHTWLNYFTKWIVSTVACATESLRRDGQGKAVNHTCIVLVGPQGIGKNTIVTKLIPKELMPYYAITQINPNDKDSKVLVTESFIINLDELESSTREEIASLKSLMTTEQVSLRKAYARRSEAYIRRASFIGSVNKAMFLTDITGSRRFLPVDVEAINLDVKVNVDQLYAQALFYLRQPDFKYWFDGKEIEIINENNKKYQVVSPEEELILKHFKPYEDAESLTPELIKAKSLNGSIKLMTNTDIFDFLQKKTEVRMSYHKLGQFLKNYGFKQKSMKLDGSTRKYYILQMLDNEESINF